MMLKTGTEVAQDYTVLKYGPQRPQKDLNTQERIIVAQPGMIPATKFALPWHIKEKVGKEPPICVDNGYFGIIIGHHSE